MSEQTDTSQRPAEYPANVLLLASPHGQGERDTCGDLLTAAEPARTNVLFVTFSQSATSRLDVWREHSSDPPGSFGVVSIEAGATEAREPGGRPANTKTVSQPGDLTGVNIAMTEFLAGWSDDDNATVVCFHSLTTLLQYADTERVFKFINELTSVLERVGARAHFHMDPSAHDPQVIQTIKSLFDEVVEGSEADGDDGAATGDAGGDDGAATGDDASAEEEGEENGSGTEGRPDHMVGGDGAPPGTEAAGGATTGTQYSTDSPAASSRQPTHERLWENIRSRRALPVTVVAVIALLVLASLLAVTVPAALGIGEDSGDGSVFGGLGGDAGGENTSPAPAAYGNGTSTSTTVTSDSPHSSDSDKPTSQPPKTQTQTGTFDRDPTPTPPSSSDSSPTPTLASKSTAGSTTTVTQTQTPVPTPAPTPTATSTPTPDDDGIIGTVTGDDGILGL